jgi:hypothetical protein
MMLVHDDLRVTHVSTHVPLREACDLVTTACVETRETEGEWAGSLYTVDLGVIDLKEFRSDVEV